MSISPGTRFGAYEAVEPVGAGGMGEVWRCRDTGLKRDVAVKVLPASFAADADRLARFRREAEILASLNHANVAQVYGLEKLDDRTVIVMELVEGPTLAERISQGPIPPDEAMHVALQVVSALEAAHANQIVHRDLKPANIKLKNDGTVKVLDFGISKTIDPQAISGGTPVMTTPAMTQTGVILGTAAYMSPEQARGKFVDERTDIWAFGCLLFEMLTGQPAFGGDDVMLTLARVLDRDTDLSSVPKTISPAVRHTIKLCLQKDPRRRIADIRDVRLALEGTFESELPKLAASGAAAPLWRRSLPLAASLIVGGMLVGLFALSRWPAEEPATVTRFEHERSDEEVFRALGRDVIAISPDGRFLVYNTGAGLFVRAMDSIGVRQLPGTEAPLTNPFFSPDGQWIGYWSAAGGQLQKMRVSGGSPVVLTTAANLQGATWTADDRIIFGQPQGLMSVSANGGAAEMLIAENGGQIWDPQLLPDGSILFSLFRAGGGGTVVIETPGREDRLELFPGDRAFYLPTGHLVSTDMGAPGTLYARTFDLSTRSYGGPVPVESEVWVATNKHHFAISPSGTLVFARGQPEAQVEDTRLAIADLNGNIEVLDAEPGVYRGPRVSPDGNQLAVEIIGDNERSSIWIFDLMGNRAPRELLGAGRNMRPLWTPDGERLTFGSDREGTWGIYLQRADGGGTVQRLIRAEEGVEYWPDSWTQDMRTLAFTRIEGSLGAISTQGLWTVGVDEDGNAAEPAPFVADNAGGASFSPSGRWLAYRSTDVDLNQAGGEINVQPFPATGEIHAVTDRGGSYPIWTQDGRALIYRRPSSGVAIALTLGRVDVTSDANFAWSGESEMVVPRGVANFGYRGFDLLPDGRIVTVIASDSSELSGGFRPAIQIATNWFELVKERAPVR